METRAHYVAVGAFVLVLIAVAFIAVLWIGRAQLTTQYADYDVYFRGPVSGLREGATVEYNGVPSGRVKEIRIDPSNVEQIRVTVEIESKVVIKQDAAANLETNLLSGVSYIQIAGGTQDAPVLTAEAGSRHPVIRSRRSRLASVTARLPQILGKLDETADHLNDLLGEDNRKAISVILANLRTVSDDLASDTKPALTAMTSLLNNLDRSYSEPGGLREGLSNGIGNFDKLARNLNDTNHQLQLTLQDARPGVRNFSQRTLTDVGELVGEARQLIAGLGRLVAGLDRDPSRVLFGDRRKGYQPQ
ncbi:MAG TPA: MlaD family protein [Stellaceae bacterium]|jgi:phospholipid/cholesterol/gamma-HCH transport system substrate-binding protein